MNISSFVCFGRERAREKQEKRYVSTFHVKLNLNSEATYIHRTISLFVYVYFIKLCFLSQREIYAYLCFICGRDLSKASSYLLFSHVIFLLFRNRKTRS